MTAMTCSPANPFLPTGPRRAVASLRNTLLRLPVRDALVAAWLVLAASAVVYADEHLQDWIPDVLAIPDGFALERWVLGPIVSRLAAGYATPGLATPVLQVLNVAVALTALGGVAAWRVARRTERASIPVELRGG